MIFFWKNGRFFRADMAGLGKYCMGGYGRIGELEHLAPTATVILLVGLIKRRTGTSVYYILLIMFMMFMICYHTSLIQWSLMPY